MAAKEINIKLFIHKEKKRVLYAESGPDFVDVLLSFLTLPIGAIIKLTEKKSDIVCLDGLYKSVEDLDVGYLQTEECKAMLLSPKMENDSRGRCHNLIIGTHDDLDNNFYFYMCSNWNCSTEAHFLCSMFNNSSKCHCGSRMNRKGILLKHENSEVFVRGRGKFMIEDDLTLKPVSTKNCLLLLRQHGITDLEAVEESDVLVGREEVLQLLKQSLISKTPMNDVFLKKQEIPVFPVKPDEAKVKLEPSQAPVKLEPLEAEQVKLEQPFDIKHRDSKRITMKLLVSKTKNKVLCAEANEDFVDLLFSFLTFPLGSITKLLDKSSIGRVADVYKSVETLCIDGNVLSENAKELLLKPKVAFHYGIKKQLVPIDEAKQWHVNILKCSTCFNESKRTCSHGLGKVNLSVTNPKFVNTVTASGAGYVKGPQTFLITDDLRVKPFSTASCMALAKDLGVPFSDLEEKEASIGEHEALAILQGSFTSNMVLTQVFCQKKRKLEDVDTAAETEECKKRLNCKRNTKGGQNLIVID